MAILEAAGALVGKFALFTIIGALAVVFIIHYAMGWLRVFGWGLRSRVHCGESSSWGKRAVGQENVEVRLNREGSENFRQS